MLLLLMIQVEKKNSRLEKRGRENRKSNRVWKHGGLTVEERVIARFRLQSDKRFRV